MKWPWKRKTRQKNPKELVAEVRNVWDMTRMNYWGYNAHWFPSEAVGEQAVMYCPMRPCMGDILEDAEYSYVIVEVDTSLDPGDQHFVKVLSLHEFRGKYITTKLGSEYL